jgi:hypothetical protein
MSGTPVRRSTSLNRRFLALLLVAQCLVAACTWALWQFSLADQVDELQGDRFRFSLSQARAGLESGLRLGLNTADLPGAQALIDQVRTREPGILSIDVFEPSGRMLLTTDQGGVGSQLPAAWRDACLATAPGEVWRGRDDDGQLQCSGVLNAYDQVSGGVLLRYRLPQRQGVTAALLDHWPALAAALALLGSCAGLAGWLAVRPVERQLTAAVEALEGGPSVAVDDDVIGPLSTAMQAAAGLEAGLMAVEAEADRLDRLET